MTSVSERLIREAAAVSEQQIKEKVQTINRLNINNNTIKDIRNYYKAETNKYKKIE